MKASNEWYKGNGEGGGGIERVQRHCCKNSRLFQNMKYSMAVIKALNNISFKSVRMRAWKV